VNDRFESFIQRVTAMLDRKFPDWCAHMRAEGRSLDVVVREGVEEANGYGVETEADLETYIQCLALLSRTFSSDMKFPWACGILRRTDLNGSEKIDKIHDQIAFRRS
jgi:hypothetical protein